MTDDQPSYWGRDLISGAAAAIDRAPQLAEEIRAISQRLAVRSEADEPMDATDADVQNLLGLIEGAGVPAPPVHLRKPRR